MTKKTVRRFVLLGLFLATCLFLLAAVNTAKAAEPMAIQVLNSRTCPDGTVVTMRFNDANLNLVNIDVTPGSRGDITIYYMFEGDSTETSTGFALPPVKVQEITDELGTTYDMPEGMFIRVDCGDSN